MTVKTKSKKKFTFVQLCKTTGVSDSCIRKMRKNIDGFPDNNFDQAVKWVQINFKGQTGSYKGQGKRPDNQARAFELSNERQQLQAKILESKLRDGQLKILRKYSDQLIIHMDDFITDFTKDLGACQLTKQQLITIRQSLKKRGKRFSEVLTKLSPVLKG